VFLAELLQEIDGFAGFEDLLCRGDVHEGRHHFFQELVLAFPVLTFRMLVQEELLEFVVQIAEVNPLADVPNQRVHH
jgi:hypothetical protein